MAEVYLRSFSRDDLVRIHGWHNDASLYETLGGAFRFVSVAAEEAWLAAAMSHSSAQVCLAICLIGTHEHIGNVYLKNIDWISRNAEIHIFLGPEAARGKGYGPAALRLMIDHAFLELGLARLYCHILSDNLRSLEVFNKCGFVIEGELIRHAFKHGEYRNLVVMGLCR